MKNIFIRSAFAALLFLSFSCSNEGTEIQDQESSKVINQQKSGRSGIVFSFTDATEFKDGMPRVFSEISREDMNTLQGDNTLTDVINFYSIRNTRVYLTEKHFINTQRGVIVRSLLLDTNTGEYITDNVNVPLSGGPVAGYLGDCPQGSSFLGYCTGVEGEASYGNCVGTLAANFAVSNVQNGTACGNVVQSNGLFGSAICWSGCN